MVATPRPASVPNGSSSVAEFDTISSNAITAVDVTDGKLTMDALILQKKIFNMLNRVAITDGTYQAWREATYGIRSATLPESPIFCGGMQSEIAFDEIV